MGALTGGRHDDGGFGVLGQSLRDCDDPAGVDSGQVEDGTRKVESRNGTHKRGRVRDQASTTERGGWSSGITEKKIQAEIGRRFIECPFCDPFNVCCSFLWLYCVISTLEAVL